MPARTLESTRSTSSSNCRNSVVSYSPLVSRRGRPSGIVRTGATLSLSLASLIASRIRAKPRKNASVATMLRPNCAAPACNVAQTLANWKKLSLFTRSLASSSLNFSNYPTRSLPSSFGWDWAITCCPMAASAAVPKTMDFSVDFNFLQYPTPLATAAKFFRSSRRSATSFFR